MPKLKFYSSEKVLSLPFGKTRSGLRYAITNYGRAISYLETPEEGRFLKHSLIRGYPALSFAKKTGSETFLVHRLVAEHFLRKPSAQHRFVIHLNHKKEDNYVNNLKWATAEEKNRSIVNDRKETESGNYKLTADRVRMIKKKMLKGNNRLKTIAKQFGVSDMQIHRIKTGENWGHVKI
jgi:hypothetical protein